MIAVFARNLKEACYLNKLRRLLSKTEESEPQACPLHGPENGQSLASRFVSAGSSRSTDRFKRRTQNLPNRVNERYRKTLAADYEGGIYAASFGWFAAIQRSTKHNVISNCVLD